MPKSGGSKPAAEPKTGRAADRRREEGRAPEPQGPKDTRTSLRQAPQGRTVEVPTLSCVGGPEAGVVLHLGNGTFTIGRGRENELVLKDIAASRKHLRIEVEGRQVRLIDLGSGNGTKVNGKRASELELRHGDTIEIGGSVLMFTEAGKALRLEPNRDEAQARVVAAADELAKELSERLRFGAEAPPAGFDDAHIANTRALRIADARAVVEQINREAQEAKQDPKDREKADKADKQPPKKVDRLWSETFTNMPLSAVVPADHSLQGNGKRNEAPPPDPGQKRARPAPQVAPLVSPFVPAEPVLQEFSQSGPRRGSFVASLLLSALVVVVVGAIALGFWAIFFKDEAGKNGPLLGSIADEREAEYVTAIGRAQDAYVRQDWLAAREYATAALQVKPRDAMATSYQRDADLKLTAAAKPPLPVVPPPPPTAPPPTATPPTATPPTPPTATPAPRPPTTPAPKPKAVPKPARPKGLSEAAAQAQFERAIDAFRSKDSATGCELLNRVADRAPAESVWKSKAENLYLKKCGG